MGKVERERCLEMITIFISTLVFKLYTKFSHIVLIPTASLVSFESEDFDVITLTIHYRSKYRSVRLHFSGFKNFRVPKIAPL